MPKPKDIQVIREAIGRIVSMLTRKAITVTQQGQRAFVEYNPVTGAIKRVNVPYLPDDASDEFIAAVQGFLDHEVGHVLHSDVKVLKQATAAGKRVANLANIIEDVYIERKMGETFAGSEYNLENTRKFYLEKIARKKIDEALAAGNEEAARGYATVCAFRAWGGQKSAQDFVREPAIAALVKPIADKLGEDVIAKIGKCKSSMECLELAKQVKQKLETPPAPPAPPPPPPPPAPPAPPKDEEQEKDSSGGGDAKDETEKDNEGTTEQEDPKDDAGKEDDEGPGEGEGKGDQPEDDPADEQNDGEGESETGGGDSADHDDAGEGEEGEGGDEQDPNSADPTDDGDDDGEEQERPAGAGASEDDEDQEREQGNPAGGNDGEEQDEGEEQEQSAGNPGDEGEEGSDSAAPAAPDESLSSMFDEERDFDKEMSEQLSKFAAKEIAAAEYRVFTTEFDTVDIAAAADSADSTVTMVREANAAVAVMQKSLERAMAAKSRKGFNPGQRRGKINPGSLFKAHTGDERVFRKRYEIHAKDTVVSLLVDCSGSMMWPASKMKTAGFSAYALSRTLERLKIRHECVGFTTKISQAMRSAMNAEGCEGGYAADGSFCYARNEAIYMPVFKGFDERLTTETESRFARTQESTMQAITRNNVDGECVQMAAHRLLKERAERHILIVLSDGQPNCTPGAGLMDHLKKVTKELPARGVEVIGIGIMDDSVKEFYPKHVVLNDVRDLPTTLISELTKLLLQ